MLTVTDPRAVPSVARVFGTDRPADQQVAVGLLGQIESPQASKFMAALAIFSSAPDVRRTALETLRHRDPRDFLGFWIALIRAPIKYEVRPVGGPGSPGTLFIAGQKANTQRVYRPMDAPNLANLSGGILSYDNSGLPVLGFDQGLMAPRKYFFYQAQMNQMRKQEAAGVQQFAQNFANMLRPTAQDFNPALPPARPH